MTARMSPSTGRRLWRRGLVALLLGWCAALFVAGAARAASAWLPAGDLGPAVSTSLEYVQVASDPAGNSIAVWQRYDNQGDADSSNDVFVIEYAFRPAGGTFAAPRVISDNTATPPVRNALSPDVAMDGQGRALITWKYDNGTNVVVRARVRYANGSLGAIQDLMAPEAGNDATSPRLAVSPSGQAAVVWMRMVPNVVYGTTGAVGGSFAPARALSIDNDFVESWFCAPDVAIDDSGNALFVWQRALANRGLIVEAMPKLSSGGFGSVAQLSPNNRYKLSRCPRVALDAQGRATVVWEFRDEDSNNNNDPTDDADRQVVQFANRTAPPGNWGGGTFSPSATVPSLSEAYNFGPDVAVDADNTAVVVWTGAEAPPSDRWVIQAASRPSGSSFGNRQTLSGPGPDTAYASIAIGPSGDAVAIWQGLSLSNPTVAAVRRPAGVGTSFGAVDEAVDVAPPASPGGHNEFSGIPQAAIDAEGNAIGVWLRSVCTLSGCSFTPRFAGLDAAPPALSNISVPGSGTTGQALEFSVSAFDRWSGTDTSWSFGDGGTAAGAAVQHSFAAAGIYNATVTSRDRVGNGASATRTVQIQDPPAPPPAPAPLAAPPLAGPGGIDADHDGFFSNQDCNDNDAAIRPNAQEIRGNRIDENCDGRADDFLAITSALNWSWHVRGARITIDRLIARDVPADAAVEFRCSGKRCPLTRKKAAKPRNGRVDVLRAIRSQRKRFRAGQTLEVRITAPDRIGKVVRFRLKPRRIPTGETLCLRPGAGRPARCGP